MKTCLVETPHGIKLGAGRVVNTGVPIELSNRDILTLLTRHKVKIYELLVNNKKVRLNMDNYNVENGAPIQAAETDSDKSADTIVAADTVEDNTEEDTTATDNIVITDDTVVATDTEEDTVVTDDTVVATDVEEDAVVTDDTVVATDVEEDNAAVVAEDVIVTSESVKVEAPKQQYKKKK